MSSRFIRQIFRSTADKIKAASHAKAFRRQLRCGSTPIFRADLSVRIGSVSLTQICGEEY